MDFLIFANTTINTQSYLIHMKRFILPLLIIILILTSLPTKANNEIESLLKTLDKSLQHKSVYTKQKQRQIDSLKIVLRQSDNIQEKIGIAQSLCFEYSSFQKDSALVYAIHMNNLAQKSNDKELLIEAKLDYSRILSSMGFFKEALAIVNSTQQEQLSPRLKAEYFLGQVTIYNHQKTFASNENDAQENDLIAQIYRDSLLQCKEVPSNVRAFMSAPTLLFHKKYDNAIHILDSVYKSYAPYSRDAGIIAYSLASAYQGKNDSENMIKYFAISAISDVLNGARENLSLKILAKLIFESGDIDRAYKYMKNAMEDAILCNARINTIEASDMYLFIDKAFQEKEKNKFITITILLVALCFVCILLCALFIQLKKQKRKVEQANESLSYHLYEIQQMNSILADNNKIKEEYVGLYMEQYTSYINKIANLKKRALKIAKSEDIKKVTSFLHSSLNTEEDLAEFYNNFDKAILNIFPNFVEDFNALLLPENVIIPGPGKLLTPELRIFALIRLGITDSVKIAHFLQYSLSTIYNYRSKMRIKANGDRNEFEEKVARIGQ